MRGVRRIVLVVAVLSIVILAGRADPDIWLPIGITISV
jgi:hypothetical protein